MLENGLKAAPSRLDAADDAEAAQRPGEPDAGSRLWYMRAMLSMLSIVVLLLLSACDSAETAPRVPFKLTPAPAASAPDAPTGRPTPHGAHFDKPINHPRIDGVLSPFTSARAVLAVDLDGDEDLDALALASNEGGAISLAAALRDGRTFGPVSVVADLGPGADCQVHAAHLSLLSASKGVATLASRCGEPGVEQPRLDVVFRLEPRPFVLERLSLSPTAFAGGTPLNLTLASEDADGDGHDDVVLQASVTTGPGATAPVLERLVLLDRGPSLAFDAQAFEAALLALSNDAQARLGKAPAAASEGASHVMALFAALCGDSDDALLNLGGQRGLPCAPSPALARAQATWTAVQAGRGDLGAALDGYVALSQVAARLGKQPLADAVRALLAMKSRPGITLREGPPVSEAGQPTLNLPAARFLTDTLLYVRGGQPVIFDLETGTASPAQRAADRIGDPSGTLFVGGIERSCAGLFLRIQRVDDDAAGLGSARTTATPALWQRATSRDCIDTPGARREDTAGFRLLGWAPQGVLAARGREIRLVPLSMAGTATSEPRVLDPNTPRPAPLPPGRATSDGSRYAWLTPFGVVVFGSPPASAPELWRPAGWEAIGAAATDAAISPSGQRVAVVSGGRVHVLTKAPEAHLSP